MAAALAPPPARAMEEPAGPERGPRDGGGGGGGGRLLPPCLSPERAGRAAGEAAGSGAAEPPWGPRPALRGETRRAGRRRGPCRPLRPAAAASLRALAAPPAARRGLGELPRSLAWQLGGRGPAGQRQEESGARPCPPAGRQRLPEGRLLGEGSAQPPPPLPARPGSGGLKFGLLPPELHARLLDQEDYRSRAQAVEELKRVVGGAGRAAVASAPAPSLLGLISFLYTLLDDSNFTVVLGALEVIHLLAQQLGDQVRVFLAPLVSAAAKVLGDNKLAVRQEYSRLFLRLMEAAGPQQVLGLLLQQEHLQHKNSKVREEVVNICIVALLTYPGEELDWAGLAFGLAPALVDSKRRVRHAAMEAFAVLASSLGPGRTTLLFKAVDAMELEDNGDGVMHAVQARLARKTLPKLLDHGFVEYAVPLPSSGHNRGSCVPPGADTDWLLMGSRTQSAHSYCGYLQSSHGACVEQGVSPRRVLSAGKGKNKLPWENKHAGDGEGGSGVRMPLVKGVEQFSTGSDFLQSPRLRPSQGAPGSDEVFFSRKRASRGLFQNSIDFTSEQPPVCAGALGSHQLQSSGRCGTLGYTWAHGQSGSVDSDLQLLGLNNCQQDKVCASLNCSSKAPGSFCSQAEQTLSFQGPSVSQGAFILPPYPLSSPRNSPKHVSSPAASPEEPQDSNTMNFSSSWPLKSFEGLPKPGARQQLLQQKSGDSTGEILQEKHVPLQLKPTLARPPASRRGLSGTRPVPPIPPIPRLASPLPDRTEFNITKWKKEECEDTWRGEGDRELAAGLSELNLDGQEVDQEEMQNSLRSLRNSAAKKRAKLSGTVSDLDSPDSALKLDLAGESPSPSTGSCSESGIYSQESLTSPVSAVPQRRRVTSDTFPLLSSKSGLSARMGDPSVAEQTCSTGLPESMSSLPQMNSLDFISPSVPPEDAVAVVGVFGSPPSAQAYSHPLTCTENGDDQDVQEERGPSAGLCGRGTQQNRAVHLHADSEREIKVTLSKSAQDKMKRKKKEEAERSHKEHQEAKGLEEKEGSPWESLKLSEPETMATENLNLCGDILTSSRNVSLSLENVALNPSSLRRTSSLRKTKCGAFLDADDVSLGTRGRYKDQTPSVTHSPEIMDPSELQPFPRPEVALTEALTWLADDDWEKKIEGLNSVRCLSAYHGTVLTAKLHETSLAVAQEVKNLRSGVSRAAVVCLGDLFTHLKKSMDQELDNTVKVLLHKAGESNTFIREEVDKALKAMVNNVTPARALCSLINGGQSHLHSAVRRCTAQHLSDVVQRMGPERILCGTKAVADRIFPAAARFAQDSSQQTRYYGRKMLCTMMAHPDFDKALEKFVLPKDLPYIKEAVSSLREKGLGEMPLDTPSAKGRRSQTSSVGHSRSSSTSRDALSVTDRETTEVTRKAAPRNSLESEEYVKDMIGLLNAKDFRERINGIKQLLADTENNQGFVVANLVKIFDAFKSRLHDSNSKVNQVALESMHKMIPLLKDSLSPVINMLIPAMVDNNLNSKNPGIYTAATNVIQALCQHLDNYLLLQPFCTKAQFLNGKAKQDMTEKLADLVTELYPRKPYAVEQKVLGVLWHLLGNMASGGALPGAGGNIRAATAKLSRALFAQMGHSLLTHAASQPPHIRKSLEEFLELAT